MGISRFRGVVVPWGTEWLDIDPGGVFAVLYAATAVSHAHAAAGNATVQVEKGWASGIVQDLYPETDGQLWTGRNGTGQTATDFANGETLFINRFYNQSAWAFGPAVAISDDRRCILDLTVPLSPCVAGIATGTQDANQSATERGYTMPVQLGEQSFYTTMVLAAASGVETWYPVQDDSGALTRNWRIDTNTNARHFRNWGMAVGHLPHQTMPQLVMQWTRDTASFPMPSRNEVLAAAWGGVSASIDDTSLSATAFDMTILGPTGPLAGRCWAIGVATSDVPLSEVRFSGIPTRIAPLIANHYGSDDFTVAFPQPGDVIPMDVTTRTADIPVRLIGKPSTEYQARFNGGAWGVIGTTDANGVLDGSLTGQSMELGTLGVREGGAGTERTVANVGIGLVIVGCGESGADGRGDNVTITNTSYARVDKLATGTTNKWMMLIAEEAYDHFDATDRCPVGFFFNTQGSTWMVPRPAQASTDGQWNADADGSGSMTRRVHLQLSKLIAANADTFPTGVIIIEDLGLNDASVGAANTDMTANWQTYAKAKRTAWRNAIHDDLNVHHIVSLSATGLTDASLGRVRAGQVALYDDADPFGSAGSQAHLDAPTDVDGDHLWTNAEKTVAAKGAFRCAVLGDRQPRYSSAAIDGADVDITLTGGTSPMTIDSTSDVAGWTVTDGNGARTVSAVNVSGMVVTLTCDQALSGTVSVAWITGADAVGTTLDDSHAYFPMPPEPFAFEVEA